MSKIKKVFITGANGFAGLYLIDLLLEKKNLKIIGTYRKKIPKMYKKKIFWEKCDLLEIKQIQKILKRHKPDQIYHLAAVIGVKKLQHNPIPAFKSNILGTANLLQAVAETIPKAKILNVGSAEEYGKVKIMPIKENAHLIPYTAYGLSKKIQEEVAEFYEKNFNLDIVYSRTFHYTGPGQPLGFVFIDLISQIIKLEKQVRKEIQVGNLSAKRDFSDIRDIVSAYYFLIQKGKKGEKFNVCSGTSRSIRKFLDIMLNSCNHKIKVTIDPEKIRKVDVPNFVGDNTKLRKLGWRPKYRIETTIEDIFNFLKIR